MPPPSDTPEKDQPVAEGSDSARRSDPGNQAGPRDGRLLRPLFYLVWIFVVPFALAVGTVWLLTPSSPHGGAGGLRVFVGEQQIPVGIVLFTVFAMAIWRLRHDLPFAEVIGVGGRRDIPPKARARFEDASALLDEAHRILRTRKREVDRELTTSEREQVAQALATLEKAMTSDKFDVDDFDSAHARADRLVGEYLGRWRKGEMREYAESIGIAVAVALLLRAFVVEAFKIPSGSMIPTLMVGDHIFVNKFAYGPLVPWTDSRLFSRLPPERGDVMVFKFPENKEQDFIKRVIAVPGDTLEAVDGRPVINGWVVPHCYVGSFSSEGQMKEVYVEHLEDKSYFTLYASKPHDMACAGNDDCGSGQACRGGVCGLLQGPFKVREGEAWVMGDNRNNSHDSRSWRGGLGAGVPFENIKGRAMFVWMSFGPGGGVAQDRLFVNVMGRPQIPSPHDPSLKVALEKCMKERPPVAQTTPPPARGSAREERR
ncbi:MAG: signal peptidase I [Bdellovibrionales bacterium]|nr:signal peptidase I [Polyangiaceae bacterium]NUM88226.1 signal peptidase I [Bdellovibrionales bacterium]